jgi:transposase
MWKPELYSVIKVRKPRFKTFKIDALLAEHGHSVLRLPPYHPDFNPNEMI